MLDNPHSGNTFSLQNYDTILLDADGVLLDSVTFLSQALKHIADQCEAAKGISEDYYKKRLGLPIEELLKEVLSPHQNQQAIKIIKEQIAEFKSKQETPEVAGASEILRRIKESKKQVGIVSSRFRNALDIAINKHGWSDLIDISIAGDEVHEFKPNPEGLITSIQTLQTPLDRVIFIGDSLHDAVAAQRAEVSFIGVLSGVCSKEDWEKHNAQYIESIKGFTT